MNIALPLNEVMKSDQSVMMGLRVKAFDLPGDRFEVVGPPLRDDILEAGARRAAFFRPAHPKTGFV